MKQKTKKLLVSILGYALISFALTLNIKANAGKPPFNAISLALYDVLHMKLNIPWITIGKTMVIVDMTLFALVALLYKTKMSLFYPLILGLTFGLTIDFWNFILPLPADFTGVIPYGARLAVWFSSFCLLAVGLSFVFLAKVITTPVDLTYIAVTDVFKMKFSHAIFMSQFVFAAIAFVLMSISGRYGHISILGFILSLSVSILVEIVMPFTKRIYNYIIK